MSTAAHCVDATDPSQTEVHVDARVLSGAPGVVRGVRGVSVLPGYEILPSPVDPTNLNWASARRDLAVVLLDRPVWTIKPVRLATARPKPGTAVALYSHGTTGRPGEFRNDVLNRGDLTVRADCRDATPFPMFFADAAAFRWWAYLPVLPLQPYPRGSAAVTGPATVGATVGCVPPEWRTRPASVRFQWVTVVQQGPYQIPTPITGATADTLPIDASLVGQQLACTVTASSGGGTSQVMSPPVLVGG